MQKLSSNVAMLVFVVAAYSGGSLRDINHGQLHVMEEHESQEVRLLEIPRSNASVSIVAAMCKNPAEARGQQWHLRTLNAMSEHGRHFMDVLPLLSGVIRSFLPHAPHRQKVAFAMEKGGVLDLPQGLGQITVGLGWDVDEGACDLDVSAVLMDAHGKDLEAVFFGRLESEQHGIQHTGDNLTGDGDGDDEQIIVNLDRIGHVVQSVFFVVNIYTPQRSFDQVAEPFCRIVDNTSGSELCRYALRDAGCESGLIIAKVARDAGGGWAFHALGLPCRGRTYKDSLPQLREATKVKTQSLVLRSQSSGNLGSLSLQSQELDGLAFHPPFQAASAGAKCCVMM